MAGLKLKGAVVGATAYVDGELVAKDMSVTLPAVTMLTYSFKAGGNTDLPITGLTEALEATITKIGEDLGLLALMKPGLLKLEIRWVQESVDNNGEKSVEGCRAYLNVHCKEVPGISIAVGEGSENAIPLSATRYELIVNGKQYLLIDKLKDKFIIDGANVMDKVSSLL